MNFDSIRVAAETAAFAGPRRVLIVDDHAPTRTAIKALLEQEHPHIQVIATAKDSATAMRVVRDAVPDVVVLDLNLGDEYGLDLLPEIGRHPGVAVIILTGSGDPLERAKALAAGAAAFISKISPAGELIAAILAVRPGSI